MTGYEYQRWAMRTNDGKCNQRLLAREKEVYDPDVPAAFVIDFGGVLNAALGLSGEVGEFNDMLKKWIFHEKDLDEQHLKKELGDVMWYVAMMCHSFGWNLDEILHMNIDKLKARYPEGFDVVKANNRKEGDI